MTDLHEAPPEPGSEGELFLDFANTVELTADKPTDRVPSGEALRAWLARRSLVSPRIALRGVEAQLPAFQELREVIRDVVERLSAHRRPTRSQVRSLNRAMRDGVHYHELRIDGDDATFTVGQVGDELDQARSAIAGSLAHYLADHDVDRLRVCANEGCRWVFVDHSPGGRRRWCDMRVCGNRAKVARHRARQRRSATRRSGARPS
jgi:predicted RNA-binding Zn ribbon-like protein